MASAVSGLKGNPASHRMGNANLKASRKRCWANGEKRKDGRRTAQAEAEARNKARGFTAWDEAKARRAAKRV